MINSSSMMSQAIPSATGVGAVINPITNGINIPSVFWAQPVGGTTQGAIGGAMGAGGTVSTTINPGVANFSRFRRTRVTGTASAGNTGSMYTAYTRWFRGDGGGFDAQFIFGLGANTTGFSSFVGMSTLTTGLTATDVTTLTNCVGVGFSAGNLNSGTWKIINNDGSGSAVPVDITGMTRSATDGYVMRLICPPGVSSNITISIYNAVTGAVILNPTVLSSDLPVAGTTLAVGVHSYNGAVASSAIIDYASIYVTCNY